MIKEKTASTWKHTWPFSFAWRQKPCTWKLYQIWQRMHFSTPLSDSSAVEENQLMYSPAMVRILSEPIANWKSWKTYSHKKSIRIKSSTRQHQVEFDGILYRHEPRISVIYGRQQLSFSRDIFTRSLPTRHWRLRKPQRSSRKLNRF